MLKNILIFLTIFLTIGTLTKAYSFKQQEQYNM